MQETKTLLTDEEHANMQLLEITGGVVTGVTDQDKLIGSLVLPGGITEIGDYAFFVCSRLTSISIPDSVTEIDTQAFHGCWNLKTVIITSHIVKNIEVNAFETISDIPYISDKHFTVKTDAVKALLKRNTAIRDEHITVESNMELGSESYDAANRTTKTGGIQ